MKTHKKSISGYIRFWIISKCLQNVPVYIRGYVPEHHCRSNGDGAMHLGPLPMPSTTSKVETEILSEILFLTMS